MIREETRAARETTSVAMSRLAIWLCAAAVAGGLSLAAAIAAEPPATGGKTDGTATFESSNRQFLSVYAKARAELLQRQGPIVLADFNSLTLLDGSKRETVTTSPANLLPLKVVSHGPLALFGYVSVAGECALDPADRETLRRLSETMTRVGDALPASGLSAEQRGRCEGVLQACRAWIEAVLAAGRFSKRDIERLAQRIRPALLANIRDGAQLQIDAYHAIVTRWKDRLGPERWASVRVIVMGAQMPRKNNLAVQYFARLLGEPGESPRIVYAEALFEEPRALSLLGTHLIDRATAEAVFGDPSRLDRDLLGDAARAYLDVLFR